MAGTIDWTEKSNAGANALATATKAAASQTRHVITFITASFSAAAIGLLQVKKGADVVLERYVHNAAEIELEAGIRGDDNEAVSAELAAGGAGITGKVTIGGHSE